MEGDENFPAQEVANLRDKIAEDMLRVDKEGAETQEVVATRGLQQMAALLWPDEVARGKFAFLGNALGDLYTDHVRLKEDGTRKRGDMIDDVGDVLLRAMAGYAVAALRTQTPFRQKMNASVALKKVAHWAGLSEGDIKHWVTHVGSVASNGRDIAKHEPVLEEVSKILNVNMNKNALENRVVSMRKKIKGN